MDYTLPPFRVEATYSVAGLSEQTDWSLAAYGIPDAWKETQGEGVKVAVIDTGLDASHPDILNQIDQILDFTGEGLGDGNGHGTHVSTHLLGEKNDVGCIGVMPKGRLYSMKALGRSGGGTTAGIVKAIRRAIQHKVHIINLSLGTNVDDPELRAACLEADEAGIILVCAAGNDGRDNSVNFPGAYDFCVTVGSVNKDGLASRFSSRGEQVDICAPGEDILAGWPGGRYARLSGTSMATPFVSGVLGLAIAKHLKRGGSTPLDSAKEAKEHLLKTARDVGDTGRDPSYGWGLIDPAKVLATEEPWEWRLGPLVVRIPAKHGDLLSVGT